MSKEGGEKSSASYRGKSTAKKRGSQREVRRTFKILRKV